MKNSYKIAIVGILLVLVVGIVSVITGRNTNNLTEVSRQEKVGSYTKTELDTFAQCLASNGMTMYGAAWCSHCKKEKSRFGTSFKFVPYVECPDNPKVCLDKGVRGYPTWITASGTVFEGEQGLEKLAEISGCPLGK